MRRLSGKVFGGAALSLLFFILYFLYLWLAVDLRLIYHGGGVILNFPVFYLGWDFFRESVSWPGGLVEYISAFLAQFFYIGWAGALVATMQAWLLWLCTGTIIRIAGGRQLRLICFVAPIILLILYARYVYPFGLAMGLLATLGFVCLYLKITAKSNRATLPVFLALSIILYVIAGGVWILFVMVCGVYELFFKRRFVVGVIFLLSAPILAHIASLIAFETSAISVFNDFIPRYEKGDVTNAAGLIMVYALYLLLPLTLLCLWLVELLLKQREQVMPQEQTAGPEIARKNLFVRFTAWSQGNAATMFAPLLAIVAGALVACFCLNSHLKAQIAVNYYSYYGMWQQVLEISARYPQNKFINQAGDRALFHTGGLTQEMFAYGQQPKGLMISGDAATHLGLWKLFDTYIDLGHINLAESALVQSMEMYGEQPTVLKRLALVTMIKGNTSAARVYLGALSRTLFESDWARSYLEKIERDPNLSTDEEIQRLRGMMPTIDRDFDSLNENIFFDLLDRNRHNRMAFEYLEAFYLLTTQLDKFVANLDRLNDFDYAGIPRVYEEVILLYNYKTKKKFEVPGREISAESRERFNNFLKVLFGRYGGDKKAAFYELAKDYGDSYFFYYIYGPAGMKK